MKMTAYQWEAVSTSAAAAFFTFGAMAFVAALFGCGGAPFELAADSGQSIEQSADPLPSAPAPTAIAAPLLDAGTRMTGDPPDGQGAVVGPTTGRIGAATATDAGQAAESGGDVGVEADSGTETRVSEGAVPDSLPGDGKDSAVDARLPVCGACATNSDCQIGCAATVLQPGYAWCCVGPIGQPTVCTQLPYACQ